MRSALSADLDDAGLQAAEQWKRERALQVTFEMPADDVAALVGFEFEDALSDTRSDERAEQACALEHAIGFRQAGERLISQLREQRDRVGQVRGRDRAGRTRVPRPVELLEQTVNQVSALERRQPGHVVAFFRKTKHVLGEVLERTEHVVIDAAHAVPAGLPADRRTHRIRRRPVPAGSVAASSQAAGVVARPLASIASAVNTSSSNTRRALGGRQWRPGAVAGDLDER